MYTKLSREKERISATRWGDTKKRRERGKRKKKKKKKPTSEWMRYCCYPQNGRKFCSPQPACSCPLLFPHLQPSSTLANSSLTRLWNKLAVLGLFQRTMEKEGFGKSEGSPFARGAVRGIGWRRWGDTRMGRFAYQETGVLCPLGGP